MLKFLLLACLAACFMGLFSSASSAAVSNRLHRTDMKMAGLITPEPEYKVRARRVQEQEKQRQAEAKCRNEVAIAEAKQTREENEADAKKVQRCYRRYLKLSPEDKPVELKKWLEKRRVTLKERATQKQENRKAKIEECKYRGKK